MAEHGVRYITVRVEADNVDDFITDVTEALVSYKKPVEYSPALQRAFKDVTVMEVMLGYQYKPQT